MTGAAPVGVELDGPELEDAELEDGPELEGAELEDGPELEDANLKVGASRRGRFARGSRSVTAISGLCPAAAKPSGLARAEQSGSARAAPSGLARGKPSGSARAEQSGSARAEPSGLARAELLAVLALWAMTHLSICPSLQGQSRRTHG